jgi:thiamine biosynthesis lipoprotein
MLFGIARTPQRTAGFVRGRGRAPSTDGWLTRDAAIMGTAIHVELWSEDARAGEVAIDAVMAEMHRIDRAMSPYKLDSELSRLNEAAARRPVRVSAEMFELLAASLRFSALSDGAFDVTYAGVGHLYDYRAGICPSDAAIEQARAAVGWQHLILDGRDRSVRFAHAGTRIDLGGFAKGHAVDNAARILAQRGIGHAIVSAGGDSRLIGDRRGRPWTIAIRDPRRPGEVVAVLPLEATAISTSGDYERYFERDGVRCHHVIDPKTGRSPDTIRSVTILAADGLTTEALSKSVFVMGLEQGMRLVESQPGVDAVVVDAAGRLHFSSGLLDGVPQTGSGVHQ